MLGLRVTDTTRTAFRVWCAQRGQTIQQVLDDDDQQERGRESGGVGGGGNRRPLDTAEQMAIMVRPQGVDNSRILRLSGRAQQRSAVNSIYATAEAVCEDEIARGQRQEC